MPDIRGQWKFIITSSHGARVEAAVAVFQTWRGIRIKLETEQSRSSSMIASLLTAEPDEFVLSYEYENTPKQGAVATMHAHRGSAEIRFPKTEWIASGVGEYYSGRDRANQGEISAERR